MVSHRWAPKLCHTAVSLPFLKGTKGENMEKACLRKDREIPQQLPSWTNPKFVFNFSISLQRNKTLLL